jgi:hypothetical protein
VRHRLLARSLGATGHRADGRREQLVDLRAVLGGRRVVGRPATTPIASAICLV